MQKKQPVAVGAPAPAPLLVDIPTAAKMLSTTVWQIRELGWSKRLPYIKLGKKWLFTPASLEAFVRKAGAA
jgi:hypothetical protein